MEREFLKPIEAAAALGLSKSRVYEALQRNEIPNTRIAGMLRIPRRWIEDQIKAALHEQAEKSEGGAIHKSPLTATPVRNR
jgi:excisionase family DNA binding protein